MAVIHAGIRRAMTRLGFGQPKRGPWVTLAWFAAVLHVLILVADLRHATFVRCGFTGLSILVLLAIAVGKSKWFVIACQTICWLWLLSCLALGAYLVSVGWGKCADCAIVGVVWVAYASVPRVFILAFRCHRSAGSSGSSSEFAS